MTNISELANKLGESEAIISDQESVLAQTDNWNRQISNFQKPSHQTKDICLPGQQCNAGDDGDDPELPEKPGFLGDLFDLTEDRSTLPEQILDVTEVASNLI